MEAPIAEAAPFLDRVFRLLAEEGIEVTTYELDHVCYRVESAERYSQLKAAFSRMGHLLSEETIGGRLIATYRLNEPMRYAGREIRCLELPAPKSGSAYPEGYEHAEFVIDDEFDEFMRRYPAVSFDTRAMAKPINPDISIRRSGCSVKFHRHPLEYVIEYLQ